MTNKDKNQNQKPSTKSMDMSSYIAKMNQNIDFNFNSKRPSTISMEYQETDKK